jgi:hypothetical protein
MRVERFAEQPICKIDQTRARVANHPSLSLREKYRTALVRLWSPVLVWSHPRRREGNRKAILRGMHRFGRICFPRVRRCLNYSSPLGP